MKYKIGDKFYIPKTGRHLRIVDTTIDNAILYDNFYHVHIQKEDEEIHELHLSDGYFQSLVLEGVIIIYNTNPIKYIRPLMFDNNK